VVAQGVALALLGYLLGSIPWGVIIARLVGGPDPRTVGSGRTGGANVLRALGPRWAAISGALDVLKGVVAVLVARGVGAGVEIQILVALATVVGHSRSVFLGFGGGRGVAPGWGGLLVLAPVVALAVVPVFALVIAVTRYSSLGSLTGSALAGLLLALLTALWNLPPVFYAYALAGPALIWYFHADNIDRLLRGQERKLTFPGGR
jgi:glycerol-3-phosphate acyltransferase PlsY